jgi:hypothetical protein
VINFVRRNLVIIILFLIVVITRLVIAFYPPTNLLYSPDERILNDSTLLLFMNTSPTCLEWPATTLMIPLFIISFISMLLSTEFIPSMMNMDMIAISESINSHLYHSFNNLELIQGGRILIAIAALISFCLIVYLLRNENKSFLYFFAFLFAVSGALVIQSWVLHPDSAAVLFWILFIVFYLFSFRLESHKSILTLATLFAFLAVNLPMFYLVHYCCLVCL